MKMYVMTDIHFYSKRNWEGNPYDWKRAADQLQRRESEEIIKEAFDVILEEGEVDTVLITGDVTNNGERTSHEDLLKILYEYKEKGLRILITTATHDYKELHKNAYGFNPKEIFAIGYDKNGAEHRKVECVRRAELAEMYKDFGRGEAIAVHEESMSYVVELDEKHWLLAINDDYVCNPKGLLRGYDVKEIEWIKTWAKKGKEAGKYMLACTHHPVLEPSPAFKLVGPNDLLANGRKIASELADLDVNIIFTGHSHIHDIEYQKSENGNPFYDVSSAALVGYPPKMRKVEFDMEEGIMDVKTVLLKKLRRFDLGDVELPEYCRQGFIGMLEDLAVAAGTDEKKFAGYANGFSMRPHTVHKYWKIIKPIGRWLNKFTFGKAYRWCRKESGLTKAELAPIKDEKVLPTIIHMIEHLYAGNANTEPTSPRYRMVMGAVAVADSVVRALPIDFEKLTGFSAAADIVEPLLYNNGLDDDDIVIDLKKEPKLPSALPAFYSRKGGFIVAGVVLTALLLSPILIPVGLIAAAIILPQKAAAKKKKARLAAAKREEKGENPT